MAKSKSKTQSTETLAPNAAYAPQINDGADALRDAYTRSSGLLERYMPRLEGGLDYYGRVGRGEFMNANPYLEEVIGRGNRSIADSVNSEFSGAGRYGSGAHTGTLADRIAANENNIRFGEYGRERLLMDQAPRNMADLVQIMASGPQGLANNYAGGLSGLLGRYVTGTGNSTTTQKQGLGGLLAAVAGAGLSGWAGGGFRGI